MLFGRQHKTSRRKSTGHIQAKKSRDRWGKGKRAERKSSGHFKKWSISWHWMRSRVWKKSWNWTRNAHNSLLKRRKDPFLLSLYCWKRKIQLAQTFNRQKQFVTSSTYLYVTPKQDQAESNLCGDKVGTQEKTHHFYLLQLVNRTAVNKSSCLNSLH